MPNQNSTLRRVGIIVAIVAVLAAGALWYVQSEVNKQARAGLEDLIRTAGGVPTLGTVSYSVLSNTLEIKDIKVSMPQQAQPVDYTVSRVVLKKPNRSLIMAQVAGNLTELKGTLIAAEELVVENYVATVTPLADDKAQLGVTLSVPVQIVRNLSVDMDVLAPVLGNAARTEIDTIVAVAESCAYASRTVPSGMTGDITGKEIKGKIAAGAMEETNFGRCALERGSVSNISVDATGVEGAFKLSIGEVTMERVFISPEALRQTLNAQKDPKAYDVAMLKALFLADRPFLGMLSIKDMSATIGNKTSKFGLLLFENSSTRPFAVSLKLQDFPVDLTSVPQGAVLTQLVGTPELRMNMDFSGLFPQELSTALTKVSLASSVKDLFSTNVKIEGRFAEDFSFVITDEPDDLGDKFLVENITVNYTDQSLAAKSIKLAGSMMGLPPGTVIGMTDNFIKSSSAAISDANRQAIDAFISNPGAFTLSITPEPPKPLGEVLDEFDLNADKTVVETVKSEKTLDEQIQALR